MLSYVNHVNTNQEFQAHYNSITQFNVEQLNYNNKAPLKEKETS